MLILSLTKEAIDVQGLQGSFLALDFQGHEARSEGSHSSETSCQRNEDDGEGLEEDLPSLMESAEVGSSTGLENQGDC
jgi:hypothetical protein